MHNHLFLRSNSIAASLTMTRKKIFIIGQTWPEPTATAAGTRMMQLIECFLEQEWQIMFGSAAQKNSLSIDFLNSPVTPVEIELNNVSFDHILKGFDPDMVVFDRFLSEEQYGWRVRETCPAAIRILDTEDLHCLRKARELALDKSDKNWKAYLQNDIAKREIASIYRSDMSLIISKFEVDLLHEYFKVPVGLLHYLPFLPEPLNSDKIESLPGYEDRHHFMVLGNIKHTPTLDALKYLKRDIWPLIRKELPNAEVHVYGAYFNHHARAFHDERNGFLIKGWIADKKRCFTSSRVCLAPLRFGAGQKGKLLDAMYYGTPSVTTQIGSESMAVAEQWNGFVKNDAAPFALAAVTLYRDRAIWENACQKGFELLTSGFDKEKQCTMLLSRLNRISEGIKDHRKDNFTGSMLWHHLMTSSKYLSRWIELKNLSNNDVIDQQSPPADEQ